MMFGMLSLLPALVSLALPKNIVLPSPNVSYVNEVTVNDSGNDYQVESRLYPRTVAEDAGLTPTGMYYVTMSTAYYSVGAQSYTLEGFGMPTDILVCTYNSFPYDIDEWSFYLRVNAPTSYSIFTKRVLDNFAATDFMDNASSFSTTITTLSNKKYITYSVDFPTTSNDDIYIGSGFWRKFFNQPFVDFMSGYTVGAQNGTGSMYTRTEYLDYGSSEYNRGYDEGKDAGLREAGEASSQSLIPTLFAAVVGVPINVINGLSPFAVWDVPIVSLIISFLFLAITFWIVKRFI